MLSGHPLPPSKTVLDRDLRNLLQAEIRKAREKGDFEQEDDLMVLMDVLDSYISGRINLMIVPKINVSDVK
ncbi:MAG: hypothetical protein WBF33_16265 [Candidatus Nitrosopolaris sp.]